MIRVRVMRQSAAGTRAPHGWLARLVPATPHSAVAPLTPHSAVAPLTPHSVVAPLTLYSAVAPLTPHSAVVPATRRNSGIAQLFHSNRQTVWPHFKGAASARVTLRKAGFEPAAIHLPALRHSPPHYGGRGDSESDSAETSQLEPASPSHPGGGYLENLTNRARASYPSPTSPAEIRFGSDSTSEPRPGGRRAANLKFSPSPRRPRTIDAHDVWARRRQRRRRRRRRIGIILLRQK